MSPRRTVREGLGPPVPTVVGTTQYNCAWERYSVTLSVKGRHRKGGFGYWGQSGTIFVFRLGSPRRKMFCVLVMRGFDSTSSFVLSDSLTEPSLL